MYTSSKLFKVFSLLFLVSCITDFSGCNNNKPKREVVIYASIDQVFSEPILKEYEKTSGIKVLPVYDVEASKTTGLTNRILSEKSKPQADVYWSGEFMQTIMLKNSSVLAKYNSQSAKDIPKAYKDKDNYYTAFGGRARVLLVNTQKVKPRQYPKTINDLLDEEYPGDQIGIAYPLFGTTNTHAAAIYSSLGDDKGKKFFEKLKARGVKVVDGNSVVRDMVAKGQLTMGLTDTDDALGAKEKGMPVELVFLDQAEGEMGTLVTPNTVALIANSPNPSEGKKLIDYLLSKKTEEKLYNAGWIDFTARPVQGKSQRLDGSKIRKLNVSYDDVYKKLDIVKKDMQEIFVK